MVSAPPSPRAATVDTHLARLWGVVGSVFAIVFAALSAAAITLLAHRHVVDALTLLVVVLTARWSLTQVLDAWGERVAARLRARWRERLVDHLGVPRREGERARGDLALAIEQAAEAPALERLGASAAASLLGLIAIYWAAGWLALAITLALLGLAVPLYQRAGKRSDVRARAYQARRVRLEERQLEILNHAPELRALGAVDFGADEIAGLSDSEHAAALDAIRVALTSSLVTEFLSGVSVGLVAMVVGFALLDGRLSLLRSLVAVLVTSEVFSQVRRFGIEFHRREDAQRALATLNALDDVTSDSGEELLFAVDLRTEVNERRVDLVVRAGDRLVITGASGSGKTTLLHTLLGWRRARAGTTRRTAGPIGYVGVESVLVSGSLRDNLTLGAPVSDDRVVDCLNRLGLTGPRFNDLDAALLPDGRGFSSGERVRLVLARVLLAAPALVVVDDIAGVLDAQARRLVSRALAAVPGIALVEATVDQPLISDATNRLDVRR